MSENFNLDMIDKTFTSYKKGQAFDGVVVLKRDDGVIFNIGGKNDAFIPASDFEDYAKIKLVTDLVWLSPIKKMKKV